MSDLPPLTYSRPDSLAGAFAALERPGARIYAGGTDLLVALQKRSEWTESVRELVDIKDLREAVGIQDEGDAIRVGALVTAEELISHPLVEEFGKALAEAAEQTSAPALRSRGTVGGNLMTPHPAGDIATALLALGASAEVATSASALSTTSVDSLLTGDARHRTDHSLVLAISFPKCGASAFEKHGARRSFSRSRFAVAVAVRDGRRHLALGGIGRRPFLAANMSTALDEDGDIEAALGLDLPEQDTPGVQTALLHSLVHRACERAAAGGVGESR